MAVSLLERFIFPPPASLFITGMSAIGLSLAVIGIAEVRGKQIELSSRTGMLFAYTPALLAGLASFALFRHQDVRFLLLQAALTLHFFKRVFEVHLHINYNLLQILFSTIYVVYLIVILH